MQVTSTQKRITNLAWQHAQDAMAVAVDVAGFAGKSDSERLYVIDAFLNVATGMAQVFDLQHKSDAALTCWSAVDYCYQARKLIDR